MLRSDKIRRLRRAGLCSLLCLSLHGLAIAQAETSTPPKTAKKPAHTSTAPSAKAKHPTSTHAATQHASTHTSAQKSKISHRRKASRRVAEQVKKKRGQQAIDSSRAREIQTALIREHYMEGEPTGTWDSTTQAAMQRYQADQGWQSKTTPDSRALIKLGLGPSHDHLLNPESAMTMPAAPAADDPQAGAKQAPPEDSTPQN